MTDLTRNEERKIELERVSLAYLKALRLIRGGDRHKRNVLRAAGYLV